MKSASELSAMIRARKKKLADDPETDDAVDLSGIPADATDLEIEKQEEATEAMDENEPHMLADGGEISPAEEMDEEKEKANKRKARLASMMK